MTTIVAAVDNSAASGPVLNVAKVIAAALDAQVVAVHVRAEGDATARAVAEAEGLELRILEGETLSCLISASTPDDVHAIVVGSRGTPMGAVPAGHVALELIQRLPKPVIVVPPETPRLERVHRVVIPLQGKPEAMELMKRAVELGSGADLEIHVVHVFEEDSLPGFSDQAQYEPGIWADEFLARHVPLAPPGVRLTLRVGVPADQVLDVSEEVDADLAVVAWAQDLSPGHSEIVGRLLEHGKLPVFLIPLALLAPKG